MDLREEYYGGIAMKFKTNRNLFTHQDWEYMKNRGHFNIQDFHRVIRDDKLTCELFNHIHQNDIRISDEEKTLYRADLDYLQEHCDNLDNLDNFNITAINAVPLFAKFRKALTFGRLKNHESIISNETVKQAFDNRVIELMRTDSEDVRRNIQISASDTTLIVMSHRYNLFREEKQLEMKSVSSPTISNFKQFVLDKLISVGVSAENAEKCSIDITTHVKVIKESLDRIEEQNSSIDGNIREISKHIKDVKNKLWWFWPF